MTDAIEVTRRDGSEHLFELKLKVRAFWDDESKRWVLSRPLQADYLPDGSKYLYPLAMNDDHQ